MPNSSVPGGEAPQDILPPAPIDSQAPFNATLNVVKPPEMDPANRETQQRHRELAVLRTKEALRQTQSALAQTARSLQRTSGAIKPATT